MKKDLKHTFSTPAARFSAYITTFVAILVSTEIFRLLVVNPRSDISIVIFLIIMAIFIIIGTVLIGERNIFSHVTSFSILIILTAITIVFDGAAIPDHFLLVLALGIAYLGARPFLHRRPADKRRTISYSIGLIVISVTFAIAFLYVLLILARITFYTQNP